MTRRDLRDLLAFMALVPIIVVTLCVALSLTAWSA